MAPAPAAPRRLRLLLDVHHSPVVGEQLRRRGHDVVAACEDRNLARLPDEDLLRVATAKERASVTENARDLDRILRAWAATGDHHAGVVFTSPRRFHRASVAYPENLVAALGALLEEPPTQKSDWIRWLS